jgi:hypothetical protein
MMSRPAGTRGHAATDADQERTSGKPDAGAFRHAPRGDKK